MTKKIFKSIFLVAITVCIACLTIIMGILYNYYGAIQEQQLAAELSLAAEGVEQSGMNYLSGLSDQDTRLTWINPDGKVLFDSQTDAAAMENHAGREEIQEALANGTGSSSRYSSTLTAQTIYYAQRLADGSVLRISISRYTVLALTLSMLQPFLVILAIALIAALIIANSLSKKIVRPLEAIDLEKPLANDTYDELAPVLKKLEYQHRQIRIQQEELKERKNEFAAVTKSMNEGLVLLGAKETILSINPAAKTFFGITTEDIGEDFLFLERDRRISAMIDMAKKNGTAELQISRNSREYQMSTSCVKNDGKISGVVILIFDITEKIFAERNRREFTANVSHELKTPLQSIMGSAELMENGLVKPDDIPQFIGHIRSEAARLVSLIEDIIRLSQLDEKTDLPTEQFDLYKLVSDELQSLELAADDKHVELTLDGETTMVRGIKQLLHEIVYNLCDNAIKYNVDGGTVKVTIRSQDTSVALSVADTGIGIPKDDQERIFERFYRVDKSHSKQIGGTGLGLSIVKHAVQYMNGKITVDSEPDKGTTVTVILPQ